MQMACPCPGLLPTLSAMNAIMQGAKIANSAVLDSIDINDIDFIEVGPNSVIGEGTTVIAHSFKGGMLSFEQASIEPDARTTSKFATVAW